MNKVLVHALTLASLPLIAADMEATQLDLDRYPLPDGPALRSMSKHADFGLPGGMPFDPPREYVDMSAIRLPYEPKRWVDRLRSKRKPLRKRPEPKRARNNKGWITRRWGRV